MELLDPNDRETCLIYFRKAVQEPLSVSPWSEWWAANEVLVQHAFPLMDYVRLKHRRLLGARQILQRAGELPADYAPPANLHTQSCTECGERTTKLAAEPSNQFSCPNCGLVLVYDKVPPDLPPGELNQNGAGDDSATGPE